MSERSRHLAVLRREVIESQRASLPRRLAYRAQHAMTVPVNALTSGFTGVQRLTSMMFRKNSFRLFHLGSSRVDYLSEVGDGTGSSTVAAVINWVARTFPEAPPALWRELPDGQEEQERQHPMLQLMRRPNDYYSGTILWMATVVDWMVDGNAYWFKGRDASGTPRELWWVPSWMIEPKGDDKTFIDHYEYRVEGATSRFDKNDIVHFRFGMDNNDPKKGSSQLKSVLREVFTDDEAANFTASLLKNMGVPGLVVSPERGTTINEGDAENMKQYVKEKFGGDKRGEAMVMTGPTQIQQFGFSPEQLLLRELRRIPEERVSAVTGIPAIVVGFGAGLERSTFTNMGEARAAAYEGGLIPSQRIMGEAVQFQLLSEWIDPADIFLWRFGFDLSKVRVLQEDLYRLTQRHDLAVRGGWEMVSEARRAAGLPVRDGDDVYLRPLNVAEKKTGAAPLPVPALNGNGASNGHTNALEVAAEVVAALDRRELLTT